MKTTFSLMLLLMAFLCSMVETYMLANAEGFPPMFLQRTKRQVSEENTTTDNNGTKFVNRINNYNKCVTLLYSNDSKCGGVSKNLTDMMNFPFSNAWCIINSERCRELHVHEVNDMCRREAPRIDCLEEQLLRNECGSWRRTKRIFYVKKLCTVRGLSLASDTMTNSSCYPFMSQSTGFRYHDCYRQYSWFHNCTTIRLYGQCVEGVLRASCGAAYAGLMSLRHQAEMQAWSATPGKDQC